MRLAPPKGVLCAGLATALAGCGTTDTIEQPQAPAWAYSQEEALAAAAHPVVETGIGEGDSPSEARADAREAIYEALAERAGVSVHSLQEHRDDEGGSQRDQRAALSAGGWIDQISMDDWHVEESDTGYRGYVLASLPESNMARMREEAREYRPDPEDLVNRVSDRQETVQVVGRGSADLDAYDAPAMAIQHAEREARMNARQELLTTYEAITMEVFEELDDGSLDRSEATARVQGVVEDEQIGQQERVVGNSVQVTVELEGYVRED